MTLTAKETAKRLNVSLSLVYGLLKSGRLPSIRVGARGRGTWRVNVTDLEAFETSCKSETKEVLPPLRHLR